MIRKILCTLLALGLWGAAQRANAQTFAVTAIELRDDDGGTLTENEIKKTYFNRAKCECARPMRITLRITPNTTGSDQDRIYVVVGTGTCLNTNDGSLATGCRVLFTDFVYNLKGDIASLAVSEGEGDDAVTREPTVADLMLDRCTEDLDVNLYIFKGLENSLEDITPTPVTLSADGLLPVSPTKDQDPEAGEGLVTLRITSGSDTEPNARYQVLCERADTHEPGLTNPPGAGYETAGAECVTTAADDGGVDGIAADGGVDAGVDATVDSGVAPDGPLTDGPGADSALSDAAPDDDAADATPSDDSAPLTDATDETDASTSIGIASLDPAFVCSEASPSDGAITVKGLENNVLYRFYAVAIDEHENPSAPILLGEETPVLAEDLWERYKRSGGTATGGFCSIDGHGGTGAMLMTSLLLLGLVLHRRTRR